MDSFVEKVIENIAEQKQAGRPKGSVGRPKKAPLTLDSIIPEYIGVMDALALSRQYLNLPMSYKWFRAAAEQQKSGIIVYRLTTRFTPNGARVLLFKWSELKVWIDGMIEPVLAGTGTQPKNRRGAMK